MQHEEDYIIRNSIPEPNTGCWLWLASLDTNGYGITHYYMDSKCRGAHRLAYKTFKGAVPRKQVVHHLCENRCCVNPEHLEVRTYSHHQQDHLNKGRGQNICKNGHDLTRYGWLSSSLKGFQRRCYLCTREINRKAYWKKKAIS